VLSAAEHAGRRYPLAAWGGAALGFGALGAWWATACPTSCTPLPAQQKGSDLVGHTDPTSTSAASGLSELLSARNTGGTSQGTAPARAPARRHQPGHWLQPRQPTGQRSALTWMPCALQKVSRSAPCASGSTCTCRGTINLSSWVPASSGVLGFYQRLPCGCRLKNQSF
jgi:hypothetical protein